MRNHVTKVNGWSTSDGRIHPTQERAQAHQLRLDFTDTLYRSECNGKSLHDVVAALFSQFNITYKEEPEEPTPSDT